ncbi:MAG: ABC-F family ATP-binding cassette domain-containing protein [Chitinophaga sp.]|uniref:ABC-F family ATP-binding cassette domain-containing protein n=1 Tax=Chitinophaga sp. TaxID=1869181 RepID=UPI0025C6CCB6|nr:ABC-F family ATP-binding cassette domain-containing protein [Chitinophaga sp.]MBV8253184.1 ABC-F family ATP-binding cassette domain-containing protein [Chitinophaga sp.]
MLLNAQNISFRQPDSTSIFENVSFSIDKGEKAAIVGKNGVGKSTLLKLIAGQLPEYQGSLLINGTLYYVPQHYGHFDQQTVAGALGIAHLTTAMAAIENGSVAQEDYDIMENNWDIVARCEEAFAEWGLTGIRLDQSLQELSGGMKTKLFLAGISIFSPEIVLLDEPTNHLDRKARAQLHEWMATTSSAVLLTSHDRELLRLCEPIMELTANGIQEYGGNYDLYESQKEQESAAKEQQLDSHKKALKEAKKKQQEALERKQRADAQAKKKVQNSSDPKILLNGRKNAAENSSGKLKQVHADKIDNIRESLQEAAGLVQMQQMMKGFFENAALHNGKVLFQADEMNFSYPDQPLLWQQPFTFTIRSGERIAITGSNGAGKSTLLQLLLGKLQPTVGSLQTSSYSSVLLDQDYTLIDRNKTILEQAFSFNERKLEPAQIHTMLANFIFKPDTWHKPCAVLSGGEMLRLSLCCMILQNKTPDIIFLDEPVNNLDLINITMLGKIFAEYKGTIILISHDQSFTADIGITREIVLE